MANIKTKTITKVIGEEVVLYHRKMWRWNSWYHSSWTEWQEMDILPPDYKTKGGTYQIADFYFDENGQYVAWDKGEEITSW